MMNENNLATLWEPVFVKNVRKSFDSLTDADVMRINGDATIFLQILQERYDFKPDEAQKAMDEFMHRYNSFDNSKAGEQAGATSGAEIVRELENPSD